MATEFNENGFDEIMIQVGDSGRFQKWYNIIFNLIFVAFGTMANFNPIISVASPEHWCYVPGRELTNFTLDEWKNLTIPMLNDGSGEYSRCKMYNISGDDVNIVDCLHGWQYDQTYYLQTIVTQENWVCDDGLQATNLLVFGKIGEIVGTIIGQLGDIYGRRPLLYSSIAACLIGRLGFLVSKGFYVLFVIFLIIGNLSALPIFQAPLVISVEISSVDDRASIPLLQCIGWTTGICLAPLIFWALGDWVPFIIISTVPLVIFPFIRSYMIESPRWLATKGRMKECVRELQKIAKINKSVISDKVLTSLNNETTPPEKSYGVMSLFSSCSLTLKTILVIIGWICYMTIYLTLYLNVTNLKGNPFMNYFWQGIAELPGYFLGKYLCDAIGRKYTKFFSFTTTGIASIVLAYILSVSGNIIIISVCGIIMKFLASANFYAINLQTIEIYPTCLRQTGYSIGFTVSSIFGIVTPYIAYLGIVIHPSLPYVIITICAFVGAISGMFIPETLNEKLPETIKEAEEFGRDQKIWSFPKRKTSKRNNLNNAI